MKNLLQKYRQLKPQPRAAISALISVVCNGVLALGKFVFAIFKGVFFLTSGLINIFFGFAKLECFFGLKKHDDQSFKYRNIKVGSFLLVAGIQYVIYMLTLMLDKRAAMHYTDFLSINIALIAFVELGIAIYGMFKIGGKGHYYRDIKLINLCSALTALMWAEVALLSFTTGVENMFISGLSGVIVGSIIIMVAVYIFFAPKVSLIDREHNVYVAKNKDDIGLQFNDGACEVVLYNSKVFGDYVYKAKYDGEKLDGHIIKTKNYWHKLNIWWKIFIILFSEILIFAYGFWAIVYFFRNIGIIKRLDKKMLDFGFQKIEDVSD